jgi:predicted dehydrogenase
MLSAIAMSVFNACSGKENQVITTQTPERPAGQTDVLQLRCDPVPTVHVGFIGIGMRGIGAVERMTHIEGVEIVALCDVKQENTQKANQLLKGKGLPEAKEFYGDTAVWRQLTALPDIDLVYVATDWVSHAKIGVQAMKDGKHVAIEVPAATNMNEIWALINTSEQTRKHCMQLENCVYDFFELTTLNMVQQGLLGEIIHGEGAYIHGLQPYWDSYWNDWRMDFNEKHRGDVYPTHGLGPVCLAMNIHRGDKLNYLVAVDTKAVGNPAYLKEKRGKEVSGFRNGDHTCTLIGTEKGNSILIEHNITSPRPYNRMYQLTGTKGFANKYPVEGYALESEEFMPEELKQTLMEKYKHPVAKNIEEKAKQVGGHGGMDFIMDYRLIHCLQNGLPLDMDVYDLAEWCCLIPLTEISLDNHSAPVEIPDFTRGAWNRLNGVQFAQ